MSSLHVPIPGEGTRFKGFLEIDPSVGAAIERHPGAGEQHDVAIVAVEAGKGAVGCDVGDAQPVEETIAGAGDVRLDEDFRRRAATVTPGHAAVVGWGEATHGVLHTQGES